MPTYGKVKVDTITYDLSGTATDVSVSNIATKASPTFTGTITGVNLTLSGDLTVNGTTTTIDTTTLQVEDKNIEIGKVSSPSDTTADGGGWTLKGATDKTFNWLNATDSWTSSEHIEIASGKNLKVDGTTLFVDGTNNRVGIGESSPSYQLDVKGDTGIYVSAGSDSTAAQITISGRNSSSSGSALSRLKSYPDGSSNQSHFTIETRNSSASMVEAMRITSDQKFLIGTTTPQGNANADDLVVATSGHAGITIRSGTSHAGNLFFADGVTGGAEYQGWITYNHSTQKLTLGSDSAEALEIDSSQNATFAGTVSDSKGDLRKIIQNTQGSAYTLVAADAGKHILASGNITIPNSIFAAGDGVVIVNNTSGDLTITSGITNLYLGSDGSTGNKTLAGRCTCTVLFTSGTAGYISGGGLS